MYNELLTFMLRKSSEEVEAKDVVNSTDWHATMEMVSANQDLVNIFSLYASLRSPLRL